MKKFVDLTKAAALVSALSLAAAVAIPGIAAAAALEGSTTVTCRGAGDSCPITLNGNPVNLALESVVTTDK